VDHVSDEVSKVLAALRTAGYEPALRIEDIEITGGGGSPAPGLPRGQMARNLAPHQALRSGRRRSAI